jgi:hypothetical protein
LESEGGRLEPELDIWRVRAGSEGAGGEARADREQPEERVGETEAGEEPVRRRILDERSKNRLELRGIGARGLGNG